MLDQREVVFRGGWWQHEAGNELISWGGERQVGQGSIWLFAPSLELAGYVHTRTHTGS